MSAAILLQNIQRVVEENEELKAEISQKRDQVARLHEKNEKFELFEIKFLNNKLG